MGIENYDNLKSPIYKRKLTFNDVLPADCTANKAQYKQIFNAIAELNGNGNTIDQSELEMLLKMIEKHDTNKDGKIDNGSNNTQNELEALHSELQTKYGGEIDINKLETVVKNIITKTGNFDDYDEGVINGFPRAEFTEAIDDKYTETESKNLKDIYRFFSDNKTEDGSYADFENSSMDRRSYINLGLMANQFLRNQSANSESALTNMLNEMKRQAGGMLDGCTIQDLQNFLMIESDYALSQDVLDKFQIQNKKGFQDYNGKGEKNEGLNRQIKGIYSDNYVSSQEYSDFNRAAYNVIASSHSTEQLSGECFFDASILALSALPERDKDKLADPVFDDKNGVARVTIAGVIDPVTKKPITVELTYEEIAAKHYSGTRTQNKKILIYGMAVEKLYNTGIMDRVRNNGGPFKEGIFTDIRNVEQTNYDKISTMVSELSQLTDPEQKRAKFIELSNQIDEILNDPDLQAYTTLITNVRALKEQMSYICVDSTPLATAIKELSANKNNQTAQRTMINITNDLRDISSDISGLFDNVPVDKTEIERLEQLLGNFATRNINDEVSNSQDPLAIKILSNFENAKNKLNQIKNCSTISGTINEFKKAPKNMDVRVALESHFRKVDTEASNAETPQQKTQALRKINDFLTKLNALNSDELVIKSLISSLETTKEILTNPDMEILEIIEDDVEMIEETELLPIVGNSSDKQRLFLPLEEIDMASFISELNTSIDSYRTQTDANTDSQIFKNLAEDLAKDSGILFGARTIKQYTTIGNGGNPSDILRLLTNNVIGRTNAKDYKGQKGAVLTMMWSRELNLATRILGYNPGREFGGHAVRIVSADAVAIKIYDTNTGKSRVVPRELLERAGAIIDYVTDDDVGTYI